MFDDDELHPADLLRRHYLVKLLSISAASLTPFQQVQAGWFSSEPEKLADDKSIHNIEGKVLVNGKLADINTRIQSGDNVETQDKSEIIFVVGSDSFSLRENSQVDIEGSGFLVNSLRLISGGILSVFGKRLFGDELVMETTTATIGIRGTGVYMEAEPDLTYLCTCYGQVSLSSNQDPNESQILTATHHDVPKYISSKSGGKSYIQEAPVKNHGDDELKLLETIVGRELPEGFATSARKESYEK
ncbi:MAG: hypothetical protein ACI8XC_002291 [Gammaproteobacteria bacterium]|jgi:hypothetical protein